MFNVDEELNRILNANFFSNMGKGGANTGSIIYIENVKKVFLEPSDADFVGHYAEVEWLPTSPTQIDPFYDAPKNSRDLVSVRMTVNKAVLAATKNIDKSQFISGPHDFNVAARNGICFAFRQYVTEQYYDLGEVWHDIVKFYYSGRWPVGYFKNGLIVI